MVDFYTLKVPRKLADLLQRYIDNHPELGYRSLAEYMLALLRNEAKKIKNEES